jgi:peptidoglycan hydrolase-like protein with peptidoglycan-binding domain
MRTLHLKLGLVLLLGNVALAQRSTIGVGHSSPPATTNTAATSPTPATNTSSTSSSSTTSTSSAGATSSSSSSSTTNTTPSNSAANTPPPPTDVTLPPNGVPPTPAQAVPGVPSPGFSATTPSSTGLPNVTLGDLRQAENISGPVQVAQVQLQLSNAGYFKGPIDGTLGGSTRAAVKAFQQASQLPATGLLDAQTLAALGVTATPSTVQPSGMVGAPLPAATTPAVTSGGTAPSSVSPNVSLNAAGGVTTNPAGTPVQPPTGVTSHGGTTASEPFPLGRNTAQSFPLSGSYPGESPLFIQP